LNWYHNGYSEEAKDEMRAEAENRVQAMQERARQINEAFSPPEEIRAEAENRARSMQEQARRINESFRQQEKLPAPPPPPPSLPPPDPDPSCRACPPEPPGGSLFFGLDNDRLIILALLWILWREHCDIKLLLALLYLLL
jgi:hypothetical protein